MEEANDSDDGNDGVLSDALDIGFRVRSMLASPTAQTAQVDQVVPDAEACNDGRGARAGDGRSEPQAVCAVRQDDDDDADRGDSAAAPAGGTDEAGDDE